MVVYSEKYNRVNEILKEWNPIGVPEPALSDEYSNYIIPLLERNKDKKELIEYFEHLLVDIIGLEYNSEKKEDRKELHEIAYKIYKI